MKFAPVPGMPVWLWGGPYKGPVGWCYILQVTPHLVKLKMPDGTNSVQLREDVFANICDMGKVHSLAKLAYNYTNIVHASDLEENPLLLKHLNDSNVVYNKCHLTLLQDQTKMSEKSTFYMTATDGDNGGTYSWDFSDFMDIITGSSYLGSSPQLDLPDGGRTVIMTDSPNTFCSRFSAAWRDYIYDQLPGESMLFHFESMELYPTWGNSFTKYLTHLKITPTPTLSAMERLEKYNLFGF